VQADATLLGQVVLNLCLNARDAMPHGGRLTLSVQPERITPATVSLHPDGRSGEFIRLSVCDTGFGMSEEVKNRLFEPFFTTKPVGQGTGLGLPMVQGIVKQHGGWIELQSELGEGARFDLYLPQATPCSTPLPRPIHHALPANPTPAESGIIPIDRRHRPLLDHSTAAVLLVDDEELIRELGRTILERAGYAVLTADDGEEAVDVFLRERDRVGLVILDVTMPRMSGRDAFRELMRIDPEARILFSTGYSADDITEIDGSLGLLSKPYRPHELLSAVRDAFGRTAPFAVVG
jgi:CheY-like chemotaxis protein